MDRPIGFGTAILQPEFSAGKPIIWKRGRGGLETNVRWQVRHHSPTGFEIGYAGSGPADFALNAIAALFPGKEVACFDEAVSRNAWHLHQPFKFAFLVGADRQEGRIEWAAIETWLAQQKLEDKNDE